MHRLQDEFPTREARGVHREAKDVGIRTVRDDAEHDEEVCAFIALGGNPDFSGIVDCKKRDRDIAPHVV